MEVWAYSEVALFFSGTARAFAWWVGRVKDCGGWSGGNHCQGWPPVGGHYSSLEEHGLGFAVQLNTLPHWTRGKFATDCNKHSDRSLLFQVTLLCNLNIGVVQPERGWGGGR